MNTLAVRSPAVPQPTILPPESVDLAALDREVRHIVGIIRSATMELAYHGFRLRYHLGEDWSPLGYPTEDKYRESLGIGRTIWYDALKIGGALCTLKLTDLKRISMANAKLLIQVEQSIWMDYPWVHEAQVLSEEQLGILVAKRNRQSGSFKEVYVYYRCKVPATAKKFLEETVERFKLENGLSSAGEALELLIADVHDRPNIMTAMRRSINYLNWAQWRIRKRSDSLEAQWLWRAHNLLRRAYSAVRMDRVGGPSHEEDAKEVYPAENEQDRKDYAQWCRDLSEQSSGEGGEESPDYAGMEDSGRVM